MRNFGYALFFLGFVGGIMSKVFGLQGSTLYFASAFGIIAGSLIFLISGAIRIAQGKVQLRPLDALKQASVVFAAIVGFRLIIWLAFPSLNQDAIEALISSAGFAIALGFYSTAYRKPA